MKDLLFFLNVCICTMCMPGAKATRRDPLELEFQMVVNHHVDAQIKPRSSARTASAVNR